VRILASMDSAHSISIRASKQKGSFFKPPSGSRFWPRSSQASDARPTACARHDSLRGQRPRHQPRCYTRGFRGRVTPDGQLLCVPDRATRVGDLRANQDRTEPRTGAVAGTDRGRAALGLALSARLTARFAFRVALLPPLSARLTTRFAFRVALLPPLSARLTARFAFRVALLPPPSARLTARFAFRVALLPPPSARLTTRFARRSLICAGHLVRGDARAWRDSNQSQTVDLTSFGRCDWQGSNPAMPVRSLALAARAWRDSNPRSRG
jgi:hypothetical protein